MTEPDQRIADLVVRLAEANDTDFRGALENYLTVNHSAALEQVFRHPALRRKTRQTIGLMLRQADQHDRGGFPQDVRDRWKTIRVAGREEKKALAQFEAVDRLPTDADLAGASAHRRARARLAREFPDDLNRLIAEEGGNPARVSVRRLAPLHPVRYRELLLEERLKDKAAATSA